MHRGYIKIWRKVKDSGLYQLPETFTLFMFILTEATHQPRRIGNTLLNRGQYSSGRIELARTLKQSEQTVRTGLKKLEKLEIITIETTSHGSIYTIVNYDIYQAGDNEANQQNNHQLTSDQPAANHQLTSDQPHNKNINTKHINTEEHKTKPAAEYSAAFLEAWELYPSRPGANKKEAFKAWSARLKAGVSVSSILDGVRRYAAYCKAQQTDPQFIKQPATFFGPGDHYLSDWTVQSAKSGTRTPVPDNFNEKDYGEGVTLL